MVASGMSAGTAGSEPGLRTSVPRAVCTSGWAGSTLSGSGRSIGLTVFGGGSAMPARRRSTSFMNC